MSTQSKLNLDMKIDTGSSQAGDLYQDVTIASFVACAGGPTFPIRMGPDGKPLAFQAAYPDAPHWVMKIVQLFSQS